jgi:hypothetical protein
MSHRASQHRYVVM